MVEFGVSVLKGISGNKRTSNFVLYGWGKRVHLLHSIIDRLPTHVQRQFIIDKYTTMYGATFPCISRSASGESTDSIVYSSLVVVYSSLVVVYFSLVCLHYSNIVGSNIWVVILLFIWLSIHLCIHELCEGSCVHGGSCVKGAVWWDCVGELCGGDGRSCVWWGAVWGHAHQSGIHTHHCLQLSKHNGDSHYPLTKCPPFCPCLPPCPCPKQQPGSPVQSMPT